MPQVAMSIGGRIYRVACDDGEQARISDLARMVDGKIAGMREKFGEMGDQRLTVMAAVTIADELTESLRRVGELEAELAGARNAAADAAQGRDAWVDQISASLGEAAERIELVAQDLNGAVRSES